MLSFHPRWELDELDRKIPPFLHAISKERKKKTRKKDYSPHLIFPTFLCCKQTYSCAAKGKVIMSLPVDGPERKKKKVGLVSTRKVRAFCVPLIEGKEVGLQFHASANSSIQVCGALDSGSILISRFTLVSRARIRQFLSKANFQSTLLRKLPASLILLNLPSLNTFHKVKFSLFLKATSWNAEKRNI